MAQTPDRSMYASKWLISSSQEPRYKVNNLELLMRKLLVKYPKTIDSLKLVFTEFFSQVGAKWPSKRLLKRLYIKLSKKYYKNLLRQILIDLSHDDNPSLLARNNNIQQLVFENSRPGITKIRQINSIIKYIKQSKQLRRVEINVHPSSAQISILKSLKYTTCLKSIYIRNITSTNLFKYKQAFLSSRFTLETITLDQVYDSNHMIEFLKKIIAFPKLKRLEIYYNQKDGLHIDKIPFNALSKRNISYVIFAPCQASEVVFSTPNELALVDLDFLGVYSKKLSFGENSNWDIYEEELFRSQKKSYRSLFLDLSNPNQQTDLSYLFMTCRNITRLEISFLDHQESKVEINYVGLNRLINVKHLFLELSFVSKAYNTYSQGVLRNLLFCAQRLLTVNLHLHGGDFSKDKVQVLDFFRVCADTLIEVSLKFTLRSSTKVQGIEIFYEGLSLLRKVESIKIFYTPVTWSLDGIEHPNNHKKIFLNKEHLREFCFSAPSLNSHLVPLKYKKLRKISKLILDFRLDLDSKIFKKSTSFPNLKNLELSIRLLDIILCNRVLKMLNRLEKIQTIMLQLGLIHLREDKNQEIKEVFQNLNSLFQNHTTLVFLAFSLRNDPVEVQVFKKRDSDIALSYSEVNSFFGRCMPHSPRIKTQNVTLF